METEKFQLIKVWGAHRLILAMLLVSLLILLSIAIKNNHVPTLDRQIMDWVTRWDLPGLGTFLVGMGDLTSTWPASVMGLLGVAFFMMLRRTSEAKAFAIVGLIIAVSAFLSDYTLGELIGRHRPAVHAPGQSFPSGHAFGATAFFGLWIFIVLDQNFDMRLKVPMVGLLVSMILSVGAARVYENAHWPSDIAGGYLLGGLWLLMLIPLFIHLRKVM